MNCAEFRERLLIDPKDPELKIAAEQDVCPDARLQMARAIAFERRLVEALEIPVPLDLETQITRSVAQAQRHDQLKSRGGWLALAASISLGAVVGGWLWRKDVDQTSAVAEACVAHLVHEPYAITRTKDVPQPLVQRLFHESGVDLKGAPVAVQYGQPCKIGSYSALHMVAQEHSGPVTVLYLADPPTLERRDFREKAIVGRIVPMGSGALVLLAENNRDFDELEQGFRGSIEGGVTAAATAAGTI